MARKQRSAAQTSSPEAVIYDPELTDTLPPTLAITSGFNAMAHAVEALYAVDCNPIIGNRHQRINCWQGLPNLKRKGAG